MIKLAIPAVLGPYVLFLASVLSLETPVAAFAPTNTAISPDGTRAVIDLPTSQHMRNTGGSDGRNGPGSGSGLCVFTSVEHAARWQCVRELDGFQKWMTYRPGGGYPQKLDKMLAQYVKEKGTALPPYIQHTGGDESFLEIALKTDRFPCVTYGGRDDFYRSGIYHMVNLAHLDSQRAAIIDNNRPGVWVWMTRAEFLTRWRSMDGGWAVVLLAPPPPPHPVVPTEADCPCGVDCPCLPGTCPNCVLEVEQLEELKAKEEARRKAAGCTCGKDCKCKEGECPNKCPATPTVFGQAPV